MRGRSSTQERPERLFGYYRGQSERYYFTAFIQAIVQIFQSHSERNTYCQQYQARQIHKGDSSAPEPICQYHQVSQGKYTKEAWHQE